MWRWGYIACGKIKQLNNQFLHLWQLKDRIWWYFSLACYCIFWRFSLDMVFIFIWEVGKQIEIWIINHRLKSSVRFLELYTSSAQAIIFVKYSFYRRKALMISSDKIEYPSFTVLPNPLPSKYHCQTHHPRQTLSSSAIKSYTTWDLGLKPNRI